MSRIHRIPTVLAATLLFAACASGGTAPTNTLPVTSVDTPAAESVQQVALAPTEASYRTADRVELTGMELGRMWTFQDPPMDWWQEAYDFEPSDEWLDHVRLASLRYGGGCSASFVSENGLVMTNHHCARGCIEAVSEGQNDYVEDGFYAATQAEELVCPGLHLDQLQSVTDVTDRVLASGRGLGSDTATARAQSEESDAIVEECEAESGLRCQVVSLYHGGRFHLYRYRRFEPVKLVFAPELQAAFFGGETDNFTYPRYDMDISFVRAYEADSTTAVTTANWFDWDADGAQEGDAVFVVGNPGSTSRLLTVSQTMYEKYRNHPFVVSYIEDYVELLHWIGSMGPDAERSVRQQLFSFENSLKAYSGQLEGLQDTMLVGRKIKWEAELREAVMADPELRAEYGDVWDEIRDLQRAKVPLAQQASIYNIGFIGDPHMGMGGRLIRFVRESAKPADERGEEYGAEELAQMEEEVLGPAPVNPEIATRLLTVRLRLAERFLSENDPFVREAFRAGETAEEAATRIVNTTRIMEPEFRQQLVEGGVSAVEAESDAGLALARVMERSIDSVSTRLEEITAAEAVQEERLARALFAVKGTSIPPDATFTLRITDGVVARYPYNGTVAPPKTTYWGLFERSANFDNAMPFTLPESHVEARDRIDMDTPINFVTTNDITGGNSGSPMISRDAEIVGIAFDGNIESLPNEWLFREDVPRTVGVHSAGILEALRSIYEAEALVQELVGGGM
ncbi:MAG: S46 family peptidase [Longimicrobiales bacterium]